MTAARQDGVCACLASRFGDRVVFSGDDAGVTQVHALDPLPHSDDERRSTEEAKRFLRESDRREARWNNDQRPHPPPEIARPDAKVTPVNIAIFASPREDFRSFSRYRESEKPTVTALFSENGVSL